jgi:hypothetical protein
MGAAGLFAVELPAREAQFFNLGFELMNGLSDDFPRHFEPPFELLTAAI